jgi:hypothetical protein
MILGIHKRIEDVDKAKEEKEDASLEKEAMEASIGQPQKTNQSTGYTDSGNLISRFNKSKVKCYNYQKVGHYAKDCWSSTKRFKENANLVL